MISRTTLPADGGLRESVTPYDIVHRFEKIPTKVYATDSEAVMAVADQIVLAINEFGKENAAEEKTFALGLSTGRTPLGLYRELAARCKRGEVSFSRVSVYSLDEFYPITAEEQQSRNYRIHEDFINLIDIKPENVHLIDADLDKADLENYCALYDKAASNIDLMVIGVGEQGQIGFNDTGVNPKSKTRMVQLSHNTRTVLSSLFFGDGNTPRMGITLGVGTVMKAKRIILMAWGEDKAQAIKDIVEGECSNVVPASLLQEHSNISMYIDENAASLLTRRETP
ncbi:MAG: 6-phosphogluconolactonase, partial [Tidjanibacter sp.]|nr:6-phosphogluconolactonase [Tidjanibacter sp.]